ncbi:MAG: Ig-like domain-containing protein [Acidimicrobiales bacterium]
MAMILGLSLGTFACLTAGAASAAVQGSKTHISTQRCTAASCSIIFLIKGAVPVAPTGTVDFLVDGAPAATSSGSCAAVPLVDERIPSAYATCSAVGLPQGRDRVTAVYSGDNNLDYSRTSKTIRVKKVPAA